MLTPPLNRPPPDAGDTHFGHAPGQHRSLPIPNRRAGALPVPGPDRSSLRRPLMVLATGTFAIGTDAFVIGDVLPAVARSLGVSTSSAGLLVTAFAVACALGAPILAVAGAPGPAGTPGLGPGCVRCGQPARRGGAQLCTGADRSRSRRARRGRIRRGRVSCRKLARADGISRPGTGHSRRRHDRRPGGGVPFGAFVGAWLGWRYTFIFVAALGAAAALAVRLWLPHVQPPAPASLGRRLSVAARPSTWPLLRQTTLAMAAGFSVLTYIGPLLRRRKRSARPQQLRDIRRCRNRGRGRRPGTTRRRRFRPRPRGRARRLRPHLRCGAAPLNATRHEKSRRVQSVPASQFLIWLRRSQPEPALYQRKPLGPLHF
jgi:hypothetical protein